jgi:hypothetical protein
MAAFTGTPVSATPYANQVDGDRGYAAGAEYSGNMLRILPFTWTHTATEGSGTGEINLCKLPAGKVLVIPQLSYLSTSDMAASADLHLGHRAYTDPSETSDTTAVAEDNNEWIDNADSGGGALEGFWTGVASGSEYAGSVGASATVYHTREGLTIYVDIDTGDIESGDTITGYVAFVCVP